MPSDAVIVALIGAVSVNVGVFLTYRQAAAANKAVNHKKPGQPAMKDDMAATREAVDVTKGKVDAIVDRLDAEDDLRALGAARQTAIAETVKAIKDELAVLQQTVVENRERMGEAMALAADNNARISESALIIANHIVADDGAFARHEEHMTQLEERLADLHRVIGDPDDWRDDDGDQATTFIEYVRDWKHKADADTTAMVMAMKDDLITRAAKIIAEYEQTHSSESPEPDE